MSAAASPESITAVAVAPTLHAVDTPERESELEAQEQKRWLIWFGMPALVAALFVGVTFGTGQEWWLGLAIGAIIVDICVLIWLALSSDTNAIGLDTASSHH
jgi:hypothetical protein